MRGFGKVCFPYSDRCVNTSARCRVHIKVRENVDIDILVSLHRD